MLAYECSDVYVRLIESVYVCMFVRTINGSMGCESEDRIGYQNSVGLVGRGSKYMTHQPSVFLGVTILYTKSRDVCMFPLV